jgi:hypothetical protein
MSSEVETSREVAPQLAPGFHDFARNDIYEVGIGQRRSDMNSQLWFDGIGWVGAVALLIAYALVSSKRLEGDSAAFQLLNISGSILLAANTIFYGSYPSTFVNLIWAGIAAFSIAMRKRAPSR